MRKELPFRAKGVAYRRGFEVRNQIQRQAAPLFDLRVQSTPMLSGQLREDHAQGGPDALQKLAPDLNTMPRVFPGRVKLAQKVKYGCENLAGS